MALDRRGFHKTLGAAALAFAGLERRSRGAVEGAGYGPLRRDPRGLLDLPEGFDYRVISRAGEVMSDGLLVPGCCDGMAAFSGPDGAVVLMRNHELKPGDAAMSAYGERLERLEKVDRARLYDPGRGGEPGLGGVTTVVYDPKRRKRARQFLSLAGTRKNCSGGPTPWGSWISCEEDVQTADAANARDHGYAFEVPAAGEPGLVKPAPLTALGRFRREAVAIDPRTGIVYQTEDEEDGLFYRFIPKDKRDLSAGGRLEALAIVGAARANTSNAGLKGAALIPAHKSLAVRWLPLDEPASPRGDLRYRGAGDGAASFVRGEGIWMGDGELYFACTWGGPKKLGQIWRYKPSAAEGTEGEAKQPGRLELFLEPRSARVLRNCDNLTVAPWGALFVCEDGPVRDRLRVVEADGRVYDFAANALNQEELAGACFSPDGKTLFVNIYLPGLTFAITGPFQKARQRF